MAAAVWTACTKLLFTEKSWAPEIIRGLAVLWAFLRRVSENVWWNVWFFCGENVVGCVVNVENHRSFVRRRKSFARSGERGFSPVGAAGNAKNVGDGAGADR